MYTRKKVLKNLWNILYLFIFYIHISKIYIYSIWNNLHIHISSYLYVLSIFLKSIYILFRLIHIFISFGFFYKKKNHVYVDEFSFICLFTFKLCWKSECLSILLSTYTYLTANLSFISTYYIHVYNYHSANAAEFFRNFGGHISNICIYRSISPPNLTRPWPPPPSIKIIYRINIFSFDYPVFISIIIIIWNKYNTTHGILEYLMV